VGASPKHAAKGKDKSGSRLTQRASDAAVAVTACGIMAIAVIGAYEGLRLYAYRDVIGVWTACYGETKGIRQGMKFTKEGCDVLFIEGLTRHEKIMRSCLNDPDGIPEKTYVAFLSLTYNIGGAGFCRSSVAREANNLKLAAACNNLMKFTRAGGRVLNGLVRRRTTERKLCLEGLKQ
jgi:lysozyme